MSLTSILRTAAILGMTAASAAALATGHSTFSNGQSFYGQPSREAASARVVDLGTLKYINIEYGETVTFRSEGKQFSWTFDGLDSRPVSVMEIAPPGFPAKPLVVYVAPDPLNSN